MAATHVGCASTTLAAWAPAAKADGLPTRSLPWQDTLAEESFEDRFTIDGRDLVLVRRPFLPDGKYGENKPNWYRQRSYGRAILTVTDDTHAHELRDAGTNEVLVPLDMHFIVVIPGREVFVLPSEVRIQSTSSPNQPSMGDILPHPERRAISHFRETGEPLFRNPIRRLNAKTGRLEGTDLLMVWPRDIPDGQSAMRSTIVLAKEPQPNPHGESVPRITAYIYDDKGESLGVWPNLIHDEWTLDGVQRRVVLDEQDQPVHHILLGERLVSAHREPVQTFGPGRYGSRPGFQRNHRDPIPKSLIDDPKADQRGWDEQQTHLARRAPGTAPDEDLWELFWSDGSWGLPANIRGLRPLTTFDITVHSGDPEQRWTPRTRDFWLQRLGADRPVHYWLVNYILPGEPDYVPVDGLNPPAHRWGLASRELNVFTGPLFDDIIIHPTEVLDATGAGPDAGTGYKNSLVSRNRVWNDPVMTVLRKGKWVGLSPNLLPYWRDEGDPERQLFEMFTLGIAPTMPEAFTKSRTTQALLLEMAQARATAYSQQQLARAASRQQLYENTRWREAIMRSDWNAISQMAAWRGGEDLMWYARNAPNPSPQILEAAASGLAAGSEDRQYLEQRARQLRQAQLASEQAQREWEARRVRAMADLQASAPRDLSWSTGFSSSRSSGGYQGPSAWERAIQNNRQSAFEYRLYQQRWHGRRD